MKLSNQAMGAIMMALQKSLLEQSDIVPTLQGFTFIVDDNETLKVANPPNFQVPNLEDCTLGEENNVTTGSD